jgi:hypothetical protein
MGGDVLIYSANMSPISVMASANDLQDAYDALQIYCGIGQ